jgi:hypothetical protein
VTIKGYQHWEYGVRRISPSIEKLCEYVGRRSKFLRSIGGRHVARNDIVTPPRACLWLYETITAAYPDIRLILDPCAGDGRLGTPWLRGRRKRRLVAQLEIKRGFDFLALGALPWKPDLVLCNPPFNGIKYKRWRMGPEAFLQKIFELCGYEQRVVLFAPFGLRLNVQRRAKRAKHLPRWNITSIVSLPHDFFRGRTVHSEILFFNMPRLKPHYALK